MSIDTAYEKKLKDEIIEIISNDRPIVIFGTMSMGMIAKRVLDYLEKSVTCYCDNYKKDIEIDGIPVLSPDKIKERFPNATILICSYKKETYQSVRKQLEDLGFNHIYDCNSIQYIYQTQVLERQVSSSDIAKLIRAFEENEGTLIHKNMSFVITEKCNLRCKHCLMLVPYISNPTHYDKKTLIRSIHNLSKSVDGIKRLSIIGGEVFLHPDLVEIIRCVANIKNILNIEIVTNGKIVPKYEIFDHLSKYVSNVIISDYGVLSTRKNELFRALEENNIIYEAKIEEKYYWTDFGAFHKRQYSLEKSQALFKMCKEKMCGLMVVNNRLQVCGRQNSIEIPLKEKDFVNLDDINNSTNEYKGKIFEFISNTRVVTACNYCDGLEGNTVAPAIQTNSYYKGEIKCVQLK